MTDLKRTAALPRIETMEELVTRDPGRYYSHRTRIERFIPLRKPASKWRLESLEKLLASLKRTTP